jgi:hypothetical protein
METTHWTLSFLIGTPLWILALLACLVVSARAFVYWRRHKGEPHRWTTLFTANDAKQISIWSLVAFAVLLVIALSPLAYYPYKVEFHQWRPVTGKVTEVSKRLIAQDKSMSERYVLVIDGQPYGVDDTRASLVKVGDTVSLSCKRDWQYASVPGWVCRWNQ